MDKGFSMRALTRAGRALTGLLTPLRDVDAMRRARA